MATSNPPKPAKEASQPEAVEDTTNWKGFHPGFNPWAIALVVTMATFMEVLDTSIANVSLPHIAGGLSASQDESTWVLTSYLVSNAIVLPISGWLASRVGRKRFYMSCVLLFTISSFLCGLAPNLGLLIFFRILQGAGGGGLAPSEQSILADTFPPAKRGMAFAIYGMAVVLAPAIGPTLGGYITDNMDWRWIFFINVPVGIISLLLTSRMVQDPPYLKKLMKVKIPIDYIGLGLIALGLGALQIVLDKGQEDDWFGSPFIAWFTAICGVSLVAFLIWEWFHENPIIELRLFKYRNFAVCNLLIFMLGATLFSTTVLLPQYVQLLMGYTAQKAGEVLSPGGIIIILLLPFIGRLLSKVDARYIIAIGFTILSLSLFNMTQLDQDISFQTAITWRIFQAMGLAFLFVPINTIAYVGIPREKNNQISGMLNLFRNIGGSVGISLVTTMIARRSQYHQSILASLATPGSPAFQQRLAGLTETLRHAGLSPYDAALQAQGRIYGLIQAQATTLSYIDIFWVIGLLSALVVPIVFLMQYKPPAKGEIAVH